MQAFTTLTATAVPIDQANVDTDQIIPARFLGHPREQQVDAMFHDMRYDANQQRRPDFVLNQSAYRHAAILLAGDNFGCGSSREHAVWALAEHGIRAVIAPSFSPIFAGNAVRGGLLPLVLPRASIATLAGEIVIDLPAQTVAAGDAIHAFAIDPEAKAMLIGGLDAIDMTLQLAGRIADWQQRNRAARPWVYL